MGNNAPETFTLRILAFPLNYSWTYFKSNTAKVIPKRDNRKDPLPIIEYILFKQIPFGLRRVLKIAINNAQFPRRGNPLWLPRADLRVCPYILSKFCYKFYYFEIRLNFTQAFLTIFCFSTLSLK
jgi:hypothetical protein